MHQTRTFFERFPFNTFTYIVEIALDRASHSRLNEELEMQLAKELLPLGRI